MSEASNNRRFATSAISVLVARFLACVAGFGFTALLARQLTPHEFGMFVLLFSFSSLAAIVGSLGLNRSIVKLIAERPEDHGTRANDASVRSSSHDSQSIVRRGLLLGSVGGIVSGLTAAALLMAFQYKFAGQTHLQTISILFGVIVALRTVHLVLAEAARGFHEKTWSNLFGGPAGGPVPHVVFLVVLAWFTSTSEIQLTTALVMYVVSFAVTLPLLMWRTLTLTSASDGTPDTVETSGSAVTTNVILALSLPLMLTQVGSLAMSQADIWLAGGFSSPNDIAVYGAAQRLLAFLTIPLQIAGTAIVSYIPQLHARGDKAGLRNMVGLASTVAGLPGLCLGLVFLAIPEQILGAAFGEHYQSAATLLRILTIGQMICILTGPCEILLMMTDHQRTALVVNTTATVCLFVVAPFAISAAGIVGLAVSMSVTTSLQNITNWYFARQLVGINTAFGNLSFKELGLERKGLRFTKLKA